MQTNLVVQNVYPGCFVAKSHNITELSEAEFIFFADTHKDESIRNLHVSFIIDVIKNRNCDRPLSIFLESVESMKTIIYSQNPLVRDIYNSKEIRNNEYSLKGWDIDQSIRVPIEKKYYGHIKECMDKVTDLCDKLVMLQKNILYTEASSIWLEKMNKLDCFKEMDFLSQGSDLRTRVKTAIENIVEIKGLNFSCITNQTPLIKEIDELLEVGNAIDCLMNNIPDFTEEVIKKMNILRTESMNNTIKKVAELQKVHALSTPVIFIAGSGHFQPLKRFLSDPVFDISSFHEEISHHKSIVLFPDNDRSNPEYSYCNWSSVQRELSEK